jgi:signal transduction histidine kinase/ligand-binding sensor domain-containing protein
MRHTFEKGVFLLPSNVDLEEIGPFSSLLRCESHLSGIMALKEERRRHGTAATPGSVLGFALKLEGLDRLVTAVGDPPGLMFMKGFSRRRALFWIVIILGISPISSATAQDSIAQMAHKSWTVQDGVPNNITSLDSDANGFLWVASDDGLFRFDGLSFKRYIPLPGNALQSDHLAHLYAAPNGSLWVSYLFGGLSRIDGGHVTNYTTSNGLPPSQIQSIALDTRGLWLVDNAVFYHVVGDKVSKVEPPAGTRWTVRRVLSDKKNDLWVVADGKVMLLPAGHTEFEVAANPPHGHASCLTRGLDGISCDDGLGWRVHLGYNGNVVVQSTAAFLPSEYSSLSAKDGSLWVTTYGHGVLRMTAAAAQAPKPNAPFETFDSKNGLTSNFSIVIREDREGSVWVSTDRGLDQFRSLPVHTADIPPVNIVAVTKGGTGPQVILGADRLFSVVDGQTTPLTDHFSDGGVRSLYGAVDGTIWVGADDSLWRYKGGKIAKQVMPPDLSGSVLAVQFITEDAQYGIWISVTRNGLFRLYQGVWSRKGGHADLPDQTPLSTGKDGLGNLWFGYLDGRIARLSPTGQVKVWNSSEGPQLGAVNVFARIGETLLIGGEKGIATLREGKFHRLELTDETVLRGVAGLVLATDGDLWINGSMGIVHIAKTDLNETLLHTEHKVQFEKLDYHEGVQGIPSPITALGSSIEGTDGNLYFIMRTSLNWLDPRKIRRNAIPPVVTVDELKSDDRDILWPSRSLELRPNPQTLQIHYAAGSLLIPDLVRFRYRLENYDKGWIDAGARREAFYSKLPPGRYTFQVIAANDAGVWNNSGASVTFTVLPTFAQTIWFKLLLLLLSAALFFVIYRVRLNQTKRRIANHMYEILGERQRIARDLHDTLLQSVQALMFKIAIATKKLPVDDPVRGILETTLSQSDEVLLEGRKLIANLQTKEASSDALLESLRTVGEELAGTFPSTQLIADSQGAQRILSTVVSPELFTIGREALANAFRHADAAHVWLTLHAAPEELRLELRDDGHGIEEAILAQGYRSGHWGLRNMKERAHRLGGTFELTSSPTAGTTIEVAIPAFVAYKDVPRGFRERVRTLFR